jgi:hypothetical protein
LPWALLVVWAALLFGGFVFGSLDDAGRTRIPTWARMASSLTLVAAAWSWYGLVCGGTAARFGLLLAIGMMLGFIGDLALAGLLPVAEATLVGMGAFGLGHIAYIAAMVLFGNQHGLAAPAPRYEALATWLVIGAIGWAAVALPSSQPAALRMAALPYTLLLASTVGFAMGLALQAAIFISLAVGAGLFFLSDLVVAAEMFRDLKFQGVGDLIWLTYGPGQMLIVFAVPAALRFTHLNHRENGHEGK